MKFIDDIRAKTEEILIKAEDRIDDAVETLEKTKNRAVQTASSLVDENMSAEQARKLRAAGTMTAGAYEITAGVLVATGHGLLGGLLKRYGVNARAAGPLAKRELESGQKRLKKGLEDWNNA